MVLKALNNLPNELGEESRPAFLTGSHAYGTPNDKSDVDIVVLMTHELEDELKNLLGIQVDHS